MPIYEKKKKKEKCLLKKIIEEELFILSYQNTLNFQKNSSVIMMYIVNCSIGNTNHELSYF